MENGDQKDEPIYGPSPVGPEYPFSPDMERPVGPMLAMGRWFADLVRVPAHWIRENVVEPNRGPKYYWYHRKYDRALPIDECYLDDKACIYEANSEYLRTYMVDRATLDLLRYRKDSCYYWNISNDGMRYISENCRDIADTYKREEINFFIKYGDMHYGATVMHAYNKQKHRMIMERRRALRAESEIPEARA